MDRVRWQLEIRGLLMWGCVAAAVTAGACSSDQIHEYRAHTDKVTSGAGNAKASNAALHTIDPWPRESQNTQIDVDGKRVQGAIRRYETNKSVKPQASTSETYGNGYSNGGQKN